MSNKSIGLSDELYRYYETVAYREPAILQELRAETERLGGVFSMQIGPEQGAFMAMLVKLTSPKRILEIGTFTGYSSIAMALAGDARIVAADMSEEWTNVARRYWQRAGVDARIEPRFLVSASAVAHLLDHIDRSRTGVIGAQADVDAECHQFG